MPCPKPGASCFSRQWVFMSCCSGVWRRAFRRWVSTDTFMEESREQWRSIFCDWLYTNLTTRDHIPPGLPNVSYPHPPAVSFGPILIICFHLRPGLFVIFSLQALMENFYFYIMSSMRATNRANFVHLEWCHTVGCISGTAPVSRPKRDGRVPRFC